MSDIKLREFIINMWSKYKKKHSELPNPKYITMHPNTHVKLLKECSDEYVHYVAFSESLNLEPLKSTPRGDEIKHFHIVHNYETNKYMIFGMSILDCSQLNENQMVISKDDIPHIHTVINKDKNSQMFTFGTV